MADPSAAVEPQKLHAAEAAIAGVRVAVVALNSVIYALFMDRAGTYEWLAYSIIVGANAYAVGVFVLKPYRRFPILLSSYFTTLMDAAFISAWLLATGGFESPFYLLWMLSVTAVAFRYGLKPAVFAAAVYTFCYAALLGVIGELAPHLPEFGLRVGYVALTAALGGLMSREVDLQVREKNEFRDLAQALAESEDRSRRLSDVAFEGIAIHDNGKIVEANAAFSRMFGWTPEMMIGRHAAELIDPVSLPLVAERLAHPTDEPYEVLAKRKDGSTFQAHVMSREVPWKGRGMRVVAIHDVTERTRTERAIREREALAVQNERLREMDVVKSRFINSAAHELGTPLTPIKLQAHLLRVGNLGDLNDKQRQAVDVLARNVDHLGSMVKGLLDASRVQSNQVVLRREPTDIQHVVAGSIASFRESGARHVSLHDHTAAGPLVEADAARVSQVLFALLDNAMRFTPAGGRVDVRSRREGSRIVIEVADTGVGIDERGLARLFEPFVQLHDTMQESRSGAGLSLYIARGIVEAHGGRLWATSEGPGRGSTFAFSLPAALV